MPGYYLGGNLYRPLKAPPPGGFPAVLSPHGHWVYGRLEHTDAGLHPGAVHQSGAPGLRGVRL